MPTSRVAIHRWFSAAGTLAALANIALSTPYAVARDSQPNSPRPGPRAAQQSHQQTFHEVGLPPPPVDPGQARQVPRYDGREGAPLSAGEAALWVPRVLLFPLHLVMEYCVRRPTVWFVTLGEKYHVYQHVKRVFIWYGGRAGILPWFLLDFGLRPSVGLYAFTDGFFLPRLHLTLRGGFWADLVQASASGSMRVFRNDSGVLSMAVRYVDRPDFLFYGIGADSRDTDKSFFRMQQAELALGFSALLGGLSTLGLSLQYRNASFSSGQSPSIEEKHSITDSEEVPGFIGYNLFSIRLHLVLDSRSPDYMFTAGSGIRFDAFGSFAVDPASGDLNYFRWGGELAGFWDVSGVNHVLGLRLYTEFVEKTGNVAVPFTELISLGGLEYLSGFYSGRFRGDSAVVATTNYRYPISHRADATIFFGAGNVFDQHFEDFAFDRLHLVWGLGIRSNGSRALSFDILIAFGTNRLDRDDVGVDQVRLVFGVNRGF